MVKDEPEIDYVVYTAINFPSDRLVIAKLHQMYPEEFDEKGPPPRPRDPLDEKIAAELGKSFPPRKSDWLLEQIRAMPADQTIRQLRRWHQDVFDVEDGMKQLNTDYESSAGLADMLVFERGLARIAYQEAVGNPYALPYWVELPDRDGYRDDLAKDYQKYGLARGEEEARQMIADFEAEAVAQARPLPPRARGR